MKLTTVRTTLRLPSKQLSLAIKLSVNTTRMKLFKGIGDQPKLLRPSRHPHRLANSIEDKGSLLRQKGSEAVAKGKFPFVYDMWRHTSQFLGSFLRLGGRGKFDTKNVILDFESPHHLSLSIKAYK